MVFSTTISSSVRSGRGEKNRGLVERYKLAGQITIGVALGLYLWRYPISTLPGASTTLPFFKYVLVVPATAWLAWIYVPFVTFVLTGVSNAVNLTDGLDGLAAGLTAIAALTFALFAYVIGRVDTSTYLQIYYLRGAGELTVFCVAMFGATLGFLWFNAHPAQVFMGDTGSLALGGALGRHRHPAQVGVPPAAHRRRLRGRDDVRDRSADGVQVSPATVWLGVRADTSASFGARRCIITSSSSAGQRLRSSCDSGSSGFCSRRSRSARSSCR